MSPIIAGRFSIKADADKAASALMEFTHRNDICIFHNNAPGQHDVNEAGTGGDEQVDPHAQGAVEVSVGTAAVTGVAAGAIGAVMGGPVVGLAAGATGAYVGSLAGALGGFKDKMFPGEKPLRRPAGCYLAVRIANGVSEQQVIAALEWHGAVNIERAEGELHNGDWIDFDPVATPRLICTPANQEPPRSAI